MNFLTPQLAAITAAVAIPALLILYFLRLRRNTVEVSSTLLWKKAIEDLQANAPFQKLRNNILLLLQLLALLATLLAIAQPQIAANISKGNKHVILIDRSASMQSLDGDPQNFGSKTRLQAAKDSALELVDSLREAGPLGGKSDEAMVITFDLAGERLVNFTTNKAELRDAIRSIEAVDTPSKLADAFVLAKAYSKPTVLENVGIVTGPPAVIHVYSDGRLPDSIEAQPDPDDQVLYQALGAGDAWNIGITALRAERSFDDPTKISIFVGVQSTSPKPISVDVELQLDGRTARVEPLRLPAATPDDGGNSVARPGAGANAAAAPSPSSKNQPVAGDVLPQVGGVVFPIERPDGAVATIRLRIPEPAEGQSGDALPLDNNGYIVLPPARRMAVALVTDGNFMLQRALTDDPAASMAAYNLAKPVKLLRTAEAQAFLSSKEAAEYDVVILDRWLPEIEVAGKKVKGLPAGRTLALGVTPALPLGVNVLGEEKGLSIFTTWRRDHPTLRGVNLENVKMLGIPKTSVPRDVPVAVLAESTAGPAILEATDIDRKSIILTFDFLKSDWVFDSFAYFFARTLDYFARGATADKANPLQPGETLSERLPRGVSAINVTTPDNRTVDLVQTAGGDVNFAPVHKVGYYTLQWTGPLGPTDVEVNNKSRRALAANLLDQSESQVATRPTLALATQVVAATKPGEGPGTLNLWPYLLALCCGVLLVEWFIYNRKVSL